MLGQHAVHSEALAPEISSPVHCAMAELAPVGGVVMCHNEHQSQPAIPTASTCCVQLFAEPCHARQLSASQTAPRQSNARQLLFIECLLQMKHAHRATQVRSYLTVSSTATNYTFTQPYLQLPLIVLLGASLGLLGAAWVAASAWVVKLRRRWSENKGLLMLEVRLQPGTQVASMAWGLPHNSLSGC